MVYDEILDKRRYDYETDNVGESRSDNVVEQINGRMEVRIKDGSLNWLRPY